MTNIVWKISPVPLLAGTTLPARRAGFLWVISLLSTLRSPFVTSAPRLRSANTAATPPVDTAGGEGAGPPEGGGGGGGGGGDGPVTGWERDNLYSETEMPCSEWVRWSATQWQIPT